MKKILSTIVAALVSVAFAGVVFAAEPAAGEAPVTPEVKKEDVKKPVKKVNKKKKTVKKEMKKEQAPVAPTAPAAPPAK